MGLLPLLDRLEVVEDEGGGEDTPSRSWMALMRSTTWLSVSVSSVTISLPVSAHHELRLPRGADALDDRLDPIG
jgi:hypothetical protein